MKTIEKIRWQKNSCSLACTNFFTRSHSHQTRSLSFEHKKKRFSFSFFLFSYVYDYDDVKMGEQKKWKSLETASSGPKYMYGGLSDARREFSNFISFSSLAHECYVDVCHLSVSISSCYWGVEM